MKNKILLSCLLILTVLSVFFIVNYSKNKNKIECESYHTLIQGDAKIVGIYKFYMNNKNGTLRLDGILEKNNNDNVLISRVIDLNIEIEDNHYILKSKNVKKLPSDTADNSIAKNYLPLILFYKDETLDLFVSKDNYNGWVFILGTFPSLYCNKYN